MIKLVVSDIDGCLLDDKGKLPLDFAETFSLMKGKNVKFVAASERSIESLLHLFKDYHDISFITDDGACVYHNSKLLKQQIINKNYFIRVVKKAHTIKNLCIVACKTNGIFVDSFRKLSDEESELVKKYYPDWNYENLEETKENFVKLMLLYLGDIEKEVYPDFRELFASSLNIVVTSSNCIKVLDKLATKGIALEVLQEKFNILSNETIVFCNNNNDISMVHHTSRSFLPSNENKKLKNIFTDIIGSNNEGSVTKKIKECIKNQYSTLYNLKFFSTRDERTRFAAKKILLIVMKHFRIKTAVDFGCGTGTFLKFLKDNGVSVSGLDGDYIDRRILVITEEEFIPADLTKPIHLNKKYDLSISLEVAEHLPESSADTFITSLCESSDVVLFSAAVKGQGGVGHVNEQFLSYWQKIFLKKGYFMLDIIRPEIWNDERIPPYYRQNVVIFVYVDTYKNLPESIKTENKIVDMIHPFYAK